MDALEPFHHRFHFRGAGVALVLYETNGILAVTLMPIAHVVEDPDPEGPFGDPYRLPELGNAIATPF